MSERKGINYASLETASRPLAPLPGIGRWGLSGQRGTPTRAIGGVELFAVVSSAGEHLQTSDVLPPGRLRADELVRARQGLPRLIVVNQLARGGEQTNFWPRAGQWPKFETFVIEETGTAATDPGEATIWTNARRTQRQRYPLLQAGIRRGAIRGGNLPDLSRRQLRMLPTVESLSVTEQVAFGRAGDPPTEHWRRPRRP